MRIFFAFLFIVFFISLHSEPLKVDVSAAGAILINADTGQILFEKESHLRLYPASTTKIATLLYLLEKKARPFGEKITALAESIRVVHASQRQAANTTHPSYRLEHDGVSFGIKVGEELSFETLLYGLMLYSGNDAANVLAQHVSGSIPQFMRELNHFLTSLGLTETHYNNPHGLFHPDHYTTPLDLAKLTREALKNSQFREIVKATSHPRPKSNKREEGIIPQKNRLLKPGKYFYPKAIGVKTGYTGAAGFNFVGAAEHEGRTLIAVLMRCPKADHAFQDAIKLFEAAYNQTPITRTLFAKGYDQFSKEMEVKGQTLRAAIADDITIQYYPAEELPLIPVVSWNSLSLPIEKGELVGHLNITAEDKIVCSSPLYAINSLSKPVFSQMIDSLRSFCHNRYAKAALFLACIFLCFIQVFKKKKKSS